MKFKKGLLGLALAGAAFLIPVNAFAQIGTEPYYFTPKLLYSYTKMDDFSSSVNFVGFDHSSGKYKDKDGHDNTFGGGLSVGYDFYSYTGTPIRLELEYLYRGKAKNNFPSKLTAFSVGAGGINMHETSHQMETKIQTLMANVFVDFHNETVFTPYLQAGLGGAYVDTNLRSNDNFLMSHPNGNLYRDNHSYYGSQNDWNFAWNLGAGFAWQLNEYLALDLSYRYSNFGNADFGTHGFQLSDGSGVIGSSIGKGTVKLNAHEAILGLRITSF